MSKLHEIREVFNEDINKKSRIIKKRGSPIDDAGEEIREASGNMYEDEKELEDTLAECGVVGIGGEWKVYKRKSELVKLKGGCCEKCGYDRALSALDFHHPDPKTKSFTMRYAMKYFGEKKYWEVLVPHVKKDTMLLCANCHREEHWARKNIRCQPASK